MEGRRAWERRGGAAAGSEEEEVTVRASGVSWVSFFLS